MKNKQKFNRIIALDTQLVILRILNRWQKCNDQIQWNRYREKKQFSNGMCLTLITLYKKNEK